MKQATIEDLLNLNHGDIIYKYVNFDFEEHRFVSKLPGSPEHLIFCKGEHLFKLHIPSYTYNYYISDDNEKEMANIIIKKLKEKIQKLERDIENVKDMYLDEE